MGLRGVKAALEGAHHRIALLEGELAHEHRRAETHLTEAMRLDKEADQLRADLSKVRRELEAAKGELQIATADRVLAQRALAELTLRFCAK